MSLDPIGSVIEANSTFRTPLDTILVFSTLNLGIEISPIANGNLQILLFFKSTFLFLRIRKDAAKLSHHAIVDF